MLPTKPEVWPSLFERYINAGDLNAAALMYDPEATFVPKSGATLRGRDAIRLVLAGLIESGTQMHGTVVKEVVAGDTALLYTDWTRMEAGSEEHSKAVEVLRRQHDGTWLLVVGDPSGRE